ncbi:MAG: FAD:protein FMN transferase [Desulfatitalea sp.]|nr:FAD:protein FMN transferase [Desulfatitalea sp.]NNK01247.1 FAD:protein FMN transferase [Desulfatitalea sp.]
MRHRHRIATLWCLNILIFLLFSSCGSPTEHRFQGRTMGTTYLIKVVAKRSIDMAPVKIQVDQRLEEINQSMSTYRPDSEINRFNAYRQVDQVFEVSSDFLRVMLSARQIHQITGGAWDGTVDPLVNLWGFGKRGTIDKAPAAKIVTTALEKVGFDHIQLLETGYLVKKRAEITVDLASIAKGYGVDQVAVLLRGLGFKSFLVEIGGEVYAAGRRPNGTPWRVGINIPRAEAAVDAVYRSVPLENSAMATSGDYRNFIRIADKTYSHIIDPRTGYPLQNAVVSVSVIADNCTLADGLATGIMVMGPQHGIALLDRLRGVEGMIIARRADGSLQHHLSAGMAEKN